MDIATNSEENETLAGRLPTFPSLKSSLYLSKIKTLADELVNGHRDIDSYISAIRYCVVSFDFS